MLGNFSFLSVSVSALSLLVGLDKLALAEEFPPVCEVTTVVRCLCPASMAAVCTVGSQDLEGFVADDQPAKNILMTVSIDGKKTANILIKDPKGGGIRSYYGVAVDSSHDDACDTRCKEIKSALKKYGIEIKPGAKADAILQSFSPKTAMPLYYNQGSEIKPLGRPKVIISPDGTFSYPSDNTDAAPISQKQSKTWKTQPELLVTANCKICIGVLSDSVVSWPNIASDPNPDGSCKAADEASADRAASVVIAKNSEGFDDAIEVSKGDGKKWIYDRANYDKSTYASSYGPYIIRSKSCKKDLCYDPRATIKLNFMEEMNADAPPPVRSVVCEKDPKDGCPSAAKCLDAAGEVIQNTGDQNK